MTGLTFRGRYCWIGWSDYCITTTENHQGSVFINSKHTRCIFDWCLPVSNTHNGKSWYVLVPYAEVSIRRLSGDKEPQFKCPTLWNDGVAIFDLLICRYSIYCTRTWQGKKIWYWRITQGWDKPPLMSAVFGIDFESWPNMVSLLLLARVPISQSIYQTLEVRNIYNTVWWCELRNWLQLITQNWKPI